MTTNHFPDWLAASENARRGKRQKTAVVAFDFYLEKNLFRLQKQVADNTWKPGGFRSFFIFDPKRRLISAAPFADRL